MKVTLMAALTADGFIAKDDAHLSTQWTSDEDRRTFWRTSKEIGHLVVGAKTFATFRGKMKGRKIYVYSRQEQVANPHENDIEIVSADPRDFLANLAERGVSEVLLAGGASIYTLFLQAGVVDRLLLTYEPVLFGQGVSLFSAEVDAKLTLVAVHDLSDQTKMLEYEVSHE